VGRDRAGRRIFCAEVPLTSGEETITASATALDGGGADDSIRVISSGEPVPVRMTADRNVGAPPLGVRFVVAVESDASYAPPTIDFDGDGEIDATVTERRATLTHTYPTVGLHRARLRSQSRGREITREVVLEVRDEKAVVAALQELWREFRAALIGGEVDRALSLVVASSRQKASELIRGASEHGVDLRPVYGDVEVMPGTVYPDFAELQAVHTAPGAAPAGSAIQFSRDVDGNWRIGSVSSAVWADARTLGGVGGAC
jgi:hypothetical protein